MQENGPTKEKLRQRKQWHKVVFFIHPLLFPLHLFAEIRECSQLPEKIRESIVLLKLCEMKVLHFSLRNHNLILVGIG